MKTLVLSDYLNSISEPSPTPGGGNVSAFTGALASSLTMMVYNLSLGKKRYAPSEDLFKKSIARLEELRTELLKISEADNAAFDRVIEAFKIPKEDESRSGAIRQATIEAALVPLDLLRTLNALLPYAVLASQKGNKASVSDAGVAISMIRASSEGALLNVLINLEGIQKDDSTEKLKNEALDLSKEIRQDCKNSYKTIIKEIMKE